MVSTRETYTVLAMSTKDYATDLGDALRWMSYLLSCPQADDQVAAEEPAAEKAKAVTESSFYESRK